MTSHSNAENEVEEKALQELDKAVHNYLLARGDIGDGKVLLNWGLITAATMLIDGQPAYSTNSYMQPGGFPTYSWLGMIRAEFQKWLNYFTEVDDDE